jgi:MFS family permease
MNGERNGEKRSNGVQSTYSMLIGGLMASFVATVVFTLFSDSGGDGSSGIALAAVLTGLGCAGAFMVAGMLVTDRLPWLSGGFLFASGFTAIWSVATSFSVQPRWVVVVALGVAIAMGVALGWWRFGRSPKDQAGMRPSPTMPTTISTSTTIESSPILK